MMQNENIRDSFSEALLSAYQNMLEDGTLARIARKKIEEAVTDIFRDALSFRAPARERLKERIDPLIVTAVEHSNLTSMTEKLSAVINAALQDSSAASYAAIGESLKNLLGTPEFKRGQKLKLSEIFEIYKDSCKDAFDSMYFDRDRIERDEDGDYTVDVTCQMEVEREKRFFGDGDWTVTFTPSSDYFDEEGSDLDELTRNTFCVKIHEYNRYSEGSPVKRLMWFGSIDALNLRYLPKFALYLQAAKDAACDIEIDTEGEDDSFTVEVEE